MIENKQKYPGRQWEDRFRLWSEWFPAHFWKNAEQVKLQGVTTFERLRFEEAKHLLENSASSIQNGDAWGNFWEYGWFRTVFEVPEELAGKWLIFVPGVGEEMLVWVNGAACGAVDKKHAYVTLTREAQAGDTFEIVMECYAGHGPRREEGGIVTPGVEPFDTTDHKQQVIHPSHVAIWNETIFQVGMDYEVLYSLWQGLPEGNLRTIKVIEGLKKFIQKTDLEQAGEALEKSLEEADLELKPLLSCVNGSTAPTFSVFGQSHLDLAWLWTLEETKRKCARTYSNQLELLDRYPEYRFLLCEPPILEWLKDFYPNVWERVKEKVASGQIYADGALYVESDVNIPCGESLIRQFLYGKKWFQELGVDSRVAWMPDTFGFTPQLPQIMKKCGVDYFTSQKLIRQDPECEPFPYNVFWWQGLDGTRILSHTYKENNAIPSPKKMLERWNKDRIQNEGAENMLYPFGYGDGGGGATREEVEMVRRCADLEGMPRTVYESPQSFFEKLERNGTENVFTGELYLAWHRGTYTGQAKTKLGVTKAEALLKEAEYWNAVHAWKHPEIGEGAHAALHALWKRLLLMEFHDILPGSSIARVHAEAEEELAQIAKETDALLTESLDALAEKDGLTQTGSEKKAGQTKLSVVGDSFSMENEKIFVLLDHAGRVISLKEKHSGKEFADAAVPMNQFRLYRNVNAYYDAWELGSMYEKEEAEIDANGWSLEEAKYAGRDAWVLRGTIGQSEFSQYILFGEDGESIEFHTEVDWKECHKMLKVDFPSVVRAPFVIGGVACGAAMSPNEKNWQWEKDRYEVCRHKFMALENGREGLAVLSASKYGWSTKENCISLTLLRSPVMPDKTADIGIQKFSYACRPYEGAFYEAQIPQKAIAFHRECHLEHGLRQKADALLESEVLYEMKPENSKEECHCILEAAKLAEDGSGKLILRMYEAGGVPQKVRIRFRDTVRLFDADMLETKQEEIPSVDGTFSLEFGAFEIRTLLVEREV